MSSRENEYPAIVGIDSRREFFSLSCDDQGKETVDLFRILDSNSLFVDELFPSMNLSIEDLLRQQILIRQ